MPKRPATIATAAAVGWLALAPVAHADDGVPSAFSPNDVLDEIAALGEVNPETGDILLDAEALAAAFPDIARSTAPSFDDAWIVVHASSFERPDAAWLDNWIDSNSVGPVLTREVDFDVSKHQVRYYHLDDAIAAWQVATELSNRLDTVVVRDFTHFRPSPEVGLVEVWLSDDSS